MKRTLILIVVGMLLAGGCRDKKSPDTTVHKANADLRQEGAGVPATQAASNSGGKVVYTCPMHPEVVSDQPGKCPKCGMTLVLKK